MVVGDSVAFGYGVELEDTFSKVLERELTREGAGRHEVMTFGGAGGNTYAQRKVIADNVSLYEPDVVVLAFNLNDILPKKSKKSVGVESSPKKAVLRSVSRFRRKLDSAFRSRSHLYYSVRERSKVVLRRFGIASPAMVPLPAFDMEKNHAVSAWRDTSEALLEIANELKKRHVPLLLVILPVDMQMSFEVAAMYRKRFGFKFADSLVDGLPQRIIREFARRNKIACVDLLPVFRRHTGKNLFFRVHGDLVDWNHPNRTGHEIIGEELALALKPLIARHGPRQAQPAEGQPPVVPAVGHPKAQVDRL
jgi:lysophospholipase L1-like esterase